MFRELFENKSKDILKWVDEVLGNLTEAIKSAGGVKQGTFKEILASELGNFDTIKKFYILDGKLAIDGKLIGQKAGVVKQIPFPSNDPKVRKDIVKALQVRMLKKFQ